MSTDVEKILRPIDNPVPPFPPKYMMLAGGEEMVIRQHDGRKQERVGKKFETGMHKYRRRQEQCRDHHQQKGRQNAKGSSPIEVENLKTPVLDVLDNLIDDEIAGDHKENIDPDITSRKSR